MSLSAPLISPDSGLRNASSVSICIQQNQNSDFMLEITSEKKQQIMGLSARGAP